MTIGGITLSGGQVYPLAEVPTHPSPATLTPDRMPPLLPDTGPRLSRLPPIAIRGLMITRPAMLLECGAAVTCWANALTREPRHPLAS